MQLYIENRIKQNPYNSKILQMSTPVICFGNIFNSHVATLGLNPSNKEFVDDNNVFLSGMKLRFQDCFSLSQNDLTRLNLNQTELVLRYCLEYFNNPNPYGGWFDYLERHVLSKLDISYYNGTCCHLDLVQWATTEKWGKVLWDDRSILLDRDFPFFLQQLDYNNIELLLINGSGVWGILNKKGNIKDEMEEIINLEDETCKLKKFLLNTGKKKIQCMAWSKNLQSSFGLTNSMRAEIGNWIKNNV
jgi:hypothetical protein